MATPNPASSLLSASNNLSNAGSAASDAVTKAINTDTISFSPVANLLTQTTAQINATVNSFNASNAQTNGVPVSALPNTLAKPTFVAGAKDSAAAVDVYSKLTGTPINSISKLASNLNIGALVGLTGQSTNITGINGAINDAAKTVAANNNANPAARIANTSTAITNAVRTLPPGCSDGLLNGILGTLNGANSKVSAIVNGVARAIQKTHIPCVAGMGDLVNKISGVGTSFKLTDPSASIAALSGVINSATKIGIPNVVSPVLATITDKPTINQVVANSLPSVVASSDTASLNSMASYATSGSLMLANPNLIQDYSSTYTRPPNSSSTDDVVAYQSILSTYNAANPNWDTSVRNVSGGTQDTVVNLTSVSGASSDFNTTMSNGILTTNDTVNQPMLYAQALPVTNVAADLNNQFGSTNFNFNNPASNSVVSPIGISM